MTICRRCTVIGAANIDIGGFPFTDALPGDSTPGRICLSAGGVGRNIAANLARMSGPELPVGVRLITALGGDAFADFLRSDLAGAKVSLDCACTFDDAASSVYLFITDPAGDMRLAVNDMDICARLTPDRLLRHLDVINASDAVIIDANLPSATLEWLAERSLAPLTADAVSAVKARKLLPLLPKLKAVKANAVEAEALTGLPAHDADGAGKQALRLVELGAKRAFITLGTRGTCWAEGGRFGIVPALRTRAVNSTGAGDAFTAAIVWGDLYGLDAPNTAVAGNAAASVSVESPETVSPAMSPSELLRRIAAIAKDLPVN